MQSNKKNILDKIVIKISGDPLFHTLEHRFLNSIIFISLVINTVAFILNVTFSISELQSYFTFGGIIFNFVLYYFSRILKKKRGVVYILFIYYLIALTFIWIDNAGINGTIPFIYFLIIASIIIITKGVERIIITSLATLHLISLILLEYFYPGLIKQYTSQEIRYLDIGIALVYSVLINGFLIALIMKSYNEKKEKAEEADRLKSAFLANLSHEIRTPLNAIVGFAELLNEPSLDADKRKEFTKIIESNSNHLMNLINDILDLSKIEAGQIKLSYIEFSLNTLLEEIKNIYTHKLIKEKPKLTFLTKYGLNNNNDYIITDQTRLKQIIINLLNNAINHTNNGHIILSYEVKEGYLVFSVSDTGEGIPKEKQQMIFNRFMQVEPKTKREKTGTGLGLTIVKSLTELLGGKIWVESEPGKGAIFYFTIPYVPGKSNNS
ncbi:MAG: hypothetical protein Kow0068_17740 [Marinilabiliales bacterium]